MRAYTSAEAVVGGVLGQISAPVALVLGRPDARGELRVVGRTTPIPRHLRAELGTQLRPAVAEPGLDHPVQALLRAVSHKPIGGTPLIPVKPEHATGVVDRAAGALLPAEGHDRSPDTAGSGAGADRVQVRPLQGSEKKRGHPSAACSPVTSRSPADPATAGGGQRLRSWTRECTPEGLPVYRVLTGPDDATFCRRVSEAIALALPLARRARRGLQR